MWPPSQFFEASLEDQAFAIVAYEDEMMIQAYENHLSNLNNKKEVANLQTDDDD